MSTVWKYLILVAVFSLFIVAGYFGYKYYREYKNPVLPGINAITPDCPLFLEIKKPLETFYKLSKKTELWQELITISEVKNIHRQILFLDSIISSDNLMNKIVANNKTYISINKSVSEKFESLFIIELPTTGQTQSVESFIKKVNGAKSIVMQKDFEKAVITMVNIAGFNRLFNYSVYKGLFIGSFDESVVRQAIEQLDTGTPVNEDKNFIRLQSTAGKNVDANIYINYLTLADLTVRYTNNDIHPFVNELSNICQWTETDLIIKNDELLLNGYTITSDTVSLLLDNFRQEPQSIRIPNILPYNVSMMMHFGFESFEQYQISNNKYLKNKSKLQEHELKIKSINKKYSINISKDLFSWIGNEIAIATTGTNGNENTLIVIHAGDIKKAELLLDKIANKSSAESGKNVYNREFGDYTIKKIEIQNLLPDIFGPFFSGIENNYFISIKDYVVFANKPETLVNLINNFYIQKTLTENFNYKSFSNNISDKSNIYFYCNIRNSLETINSYFSSEIADLLINNENVIRSFEGFAIQLSYINKMFYTNIYLKYNPTYQEINPSNWETEVDARIIDKPYYVRNHKNGKLNVIVFDELSNMYMIDHVGRIKWKAPLIEPPVSQVYVVDYYKNNKYQYLFNTENYLYLFDLNGNYVADYPVKLLTHATNAMSVFDYENNKDYRLMLALADNKVYNYNINAELVEGWNKVQAKLSVNQPVEHLVHDGKDYIFITDERGNVLITNRKGEGRIKLKKNFRKAKNSKIYINRTNSKGIFITTDEKGKLVYITKTGKISRTVFGDFSKEHFFFYEDFSNNNSYDFIFFDINKLKAFDRFKKVIFEYEFPSDITIKPYYFKGKDGSGYLGVVLNETKEVFIFNKNGTVFTDRYISGETPFIVGSINNDEKLNLIIGSGNKVLNYLLQ